MVSGSGIALTRRREVCCVHAGGTGGLCGRGKGQMGSECAPQWRGTWHGWRSVVVAVVVAQGQAGCWYSRLIYEAFGRCVAPWGSGGAWRGGAGASGHIQGDTAVHGSSGR